MNKPFVLESLKSELREQHKRALAALQDAADGATGDDAKAEGKYDTRGLESSYLAAGQAEQVERLSQELMAVEAFDFGEFDPDDEIAPGALVEADLDGESMFYLLAPGGGGLNCKGEDGEKVIILSTDAPLREKLLGKIAGDEIDHPPVLILEIY